MTFCKQCGSVVYVATVVLPDKTRREVVYACHSCGSRERLGDNPDPLVLESWDGD